MYTCYRHDHNHKVPNWVELRFLSSWSINIFFSFFFNFHDSDLIVQLSYIPDDDETIQQFKECEEAQDGLDGVEPMVEGKEQHLEPMVVEGEELNLELEDTLTQPVRRRIFILWYLQGRVKELLKGASGVHEAREFFFNLDLLKLLTTPLHTLASIP